MKRSSKKSASVKITFSQTNRGKAHAETKKAYTYSAKINALRNQQDGSPKDNHIRKAFDIRLQDKKFSKNTKSNLDAIVGLINTKNKYNALRGMVREILDKEIKTANGGTYNKAVNIIDNGGRCSDLVLFDAFVSLARCKDFAERYHAHVKRALK